MCCRVCPVSNGTFKNSRKTTAFFLMQDLILVILSAVVPRWLYQKPSVTSDERILRLHPSTRTEKKEKFAKMNTWLR